VQFFSSKSKYSSSDSKFLGLEGVEALPRGDGWIAYVSGRFTDEIQAKDWLKAIKLKGYPDAFLVGVEDGLKVSLDAVRESLKKKH
jgi:hypothetical protein